MIRFSDSILPTVFYNIMSSLVCWSPWSLTIPLSESVLRPKTLLPLMWWAADVSCSASLRRPRDLISSSSVTFLGDPAFAPSLESISSSAEVSPWVSPVSCWNPDAPVPQTFGLGNSGGLALLDLEWGVSERVGYSTWISNVWRNSFTSFFCASAIVLISGESPIVWLTGREPNKDEILPSSWHTVHDGVTKCKHFLRCWSFVRGTHRSPVGSPHKGQWRGALTFSVICAWMNDLVNNREAGDLRCHRAHYGVTTMFWDVVYSCNMHLRFQSFIYMGDQNIYQNASYKSLFLNPKSTTLCKCQPNKRPVPTDPASTPSGRLQGWGLLKLRSLISPSAKSSKSTC